MSYQATYSSKINTRIASDALKSIGRNILELSGKIRIGSENCTKAMDRIMNKRSDFLFNINELKSEFEYNCAIITSTIPEISASQAMIQTINKIPDLKKLAEEIPSYRPLLENPSQLKGRLGVEKVSSVLEEIYSLIEKSSIDIQTVIVVKALTDCNWNIFDSASKVDAQTIVAQNNTTGNILAMNITSDNLALDISGIRDSSCVDHANKVLKKLDEFGLKSNIIFDYRHNRPKGGSLLSGSQIANNIIKKAKTNRKKFKGISIPVKSSYQYTQDSNNDSIKTKIR